MKTEKQLVPALEKAIDILDFLSGGKKEEKVVTMSRALSIPQASAFRITNTLMDRGLLIKGTRPGFVRLGYGIARYAQAALTSVDLVRIARPYLESVVEKTANTVELSHYYNAEINFIDLIESSEPIKYGRKIGVPIVGSTNPVTLTILAHIHPVEQKQLLDKMQTLRKNIIKSNPELAKLEFKKIIDQKIMDQIRADRFCIDLGVQVKHVARIASPVFNESGNIIGTISIAGPAFYMDREIAGRHAKTVKQTADALSNEFRSGH